jgi:protein-tyrosine phosphatase
MAEALLRDRVVRDGRDDTVHVASAGTWAQPDLPPTPHAVEALGECGLAWQGALSQAVDAGLMSSSDLVLVMTRSHAEALRAEFPAQADKVTLMSELAGGRWDIADPVGGSLEDYRATRDELARLIDAGWARILDEVATAADAGDASVAPLD